MYLLDIFDGRNSVHFWWNSGAPLPKDTVLLIERAISGHERREVEKAWANFDFGGQLGE